MKTIRMTKEQKTKWLDALRSGKYVQGKHALQSRDGYCCLGVLQQVLDGCTETRSVPSADWLQEHGVDFMDQDGCYTHGNPWLPSLGRSAAGANDNGVSFSKIADALEKDIEVTDEQQPTA